MLDGVNALMCNHKHVQPLGFTYPLVLYVLVVRSLVHYTPYYTALLGVYYIPGPVIDDVIF